MEFRRVLFRSQLAETAVRESKSFTEREALDQKLVELIAPDERHLLAALDGRAVTRFDGTVTTLHTAGAEIVEYRLTLRQRIISSITDPNIALVLLVIGALGIYVEFSSPGLIAPGVLGGIMVLLGLSAISVLPINWLGAALLVLACTLFVLEVGARDVAARQVGGLQALHFLLARGDLAGARAGRKPGGECVELRDFLFALLVLRFDARADLRLGEHHVVVAAGVHYHRFVIDIGHVGAH